MKCFKFYARENKKCNKKNCRYWINASKDKNCTIISASKGTKTLHEIGEIYGITRMRVCQIEKKIIEKIKKRVHDTLSL